MSKTIKVTVSDKVHDNVAKLAEELGVTPSEYIKFTIFKIMENSDFDDREIGVEGA